MYSLLLKDKLFLKAHCTKFVCVDALRHSQQCFSHVRAISFLPKLNQYLAADKVSYSKTQQIHPPVYLKLATLRFPV